MLNSMTGFSRVSQINQGYQVVWECRSVNHRYLEVNVRLPENLTMLESGYREYLQSQLVRGKVVCDLSIISAGLAERSFALDEALVIGLMGAAEQVQRLTQLPFALEARDILRWPGVIKEGHVDIQSLEPLILATLKQAVNELVANRRREGQKLQDVLEERLLFLEHACQEMRSALPVLHAQFKQRLADKLNDIKMTVEEHRFEQEVVLHLNRSDIEEELDRLTAHIIETRTALREKSAVGRRLDFLMQELNREVNTIASKSVGIQVTQSAIDMKVWIEQMREQVQNIE